MIMAHPYTFVLERVQREEIVAYTEAEARTRLEEMGYLADEFELIDVWSAEGTNADTR